MKTNIFRVILLGLLLSPLVVVAEIPLEASLKLLVFSLDERPQCTSFSPQTLNKQELVFQAVGNNVCCCDTTDGKKCCSYVAQCGGPIPGCNCR